MALQVANSDPTLEMRTAGYSHHPNSARQRIHTPKGSLIRSNLARADEGILDDHFDGIAWSPQDRYMTNGPVPDVEAKSSNSRSMNNCVSGISHIRRVKDIKQPVSLHSPLSLSQFTANVVNIGAALFFGNVKISSPIGWSGDGSTHNFEGKISCR